MAVTFDMLSALAEELPGVENGLWYGTPSLKVRGKGFVRLKEDGVTAVFRASIIDRDYLMDRDPKTFFITDHYRGYPAVLVRLARLRESQARELLEDSWRFVAPRRLVAQHDAAKAAPKKTPASRARKR